MLIQFYSDSCAPSHVCSCPGRFKRRKPQTGIWCECPFKMAHQNMFSYYLAATAVPLGTKECQNHARFAQTFSLICVVRGMKNNKGFEINVLCPLNRQRSAVHPLFGKDEHLDCLFQYIYIFLHPKPSNVGHVDEYLVVAPADKFLSSPLERRAAACSLRTPHLTTVHQRDLD